MFNDHTVWSHLLSPGRHCSLLAQRRPRARFELRECLLCLYCLLQQLSLVRFGQKIGHSLPSVTACRILEFLLFRTYPFGQRPVSGRATQRGFKLGTICGLTHVIVFSGLSRKPLRIAAVWALRQVAHKREDRSCTARTGKKRRQIETRQRSVQQTALLRGS